MPGRLRQPRGFTIVYGSIVIFAMLGMVSLSVDWGRVQTAKSELQDAVDAASRYAVTGFSTNSAVARAQQAAAQNSVDGSTLSLANADISEGSWDSVNRTFTVSASNKTAVSIVARRTVPLLFARIIGRQSVDVSARSVATRVANPIGVIGLNGINLSGSAKITRLSSETGTVMVATNSNFNINSPSIIDGDALYRSAAPNGTVTGNKTVMTSDVVCATVPMPTGVTETAYSVNNSSNYVPGGNYYCSSVSISGSANLTLLGDVTIYCSGNFNIGNNISITTNGYKLIVYMTSGAGVTISNNNPIKMVIYAPLSPVNINTSSFVGSIVCSSLSHSGGTIQYSSTLAIPVEPTGGGPAVFGTVTTVR